MIYLVIFLCNKGYYKGP